MKPSKKLSISIEGEPSRLDHALLHWFRSQGLSLSRSRLKKLFEEGQVLLSRPHCPTQRAAASAILIPGIHHVEIHADEDSLGAHLALPSVHGSFLAVLYEDEHLLVLNKKSGIPSVPIKPGETETAVGSALAHFPALRDIGNKPLEAGLLHRLDNATSGALAFAKTPESFDYYKKAWKEGLVRKTYRALVHGEASKRKLPETLRLDLAHHIHSNKKMMVIDRKGIKYRGKLLPTITHLEKIHRSYGGISDLEITIETGVMHQIRCTLSYLGLPILGDPIYGKNEKERLALHAWKLGLPLFQKKRELTIECELPSIFTDL